MNSWPLNQEKMDITVGIGIVKKGRDNVGLGNLKGIAKSPTVFWWGRKVIELFEIQLGERSGLKDLT